MKQRKSYISCVVVLTFSLAFSLITGCSETTEPEQVSDNYVDLLTIICNPLSPAPGDVAQLTVQAIGGDAQPSYNWVVNAGSLMTNSGISVPWKVPESTGIVHVAATSSIDESSDTLEKYVMIRHVDTLETGLVASLSPVLVGTVNKTLFFIGSYESPLDYEYLTYKVYRKVSSTIVCVSASGGVTLHGGDGFLFFPEGNLVVGSMITGSLSLRQKQKNIWAFPTFVGFSKDVSHDYSGTFWRRNQHVRPHGNWDPVLSSVKKLVWQKNESGDAEDGTEDLTDIAFTNDLNISDPMGTPTWSTLTESHDSATVVQGVDTNIVHRYYRNISPMITPVNDAIVYFVDTTGTFEPCLIPIEGDVPNVDLRRAIMVDEEYGIFEEAGIQVTENTIFQWNTQHKILGFIDGKRYLCYFDYNDSTAVKLTNVGEVKEFVWSPDGSICAVVKEDGVYRVSAVSGVVDPDPIFVKEKYTDDIIGINWSPDEGDSRLGFRLVRKGMDTDESYSSIVICALDGVDWNWYYASKRMPWSEEYEYDVDYTWWRVVFESENNGIYAPIPAADMPGKEVVILHSHD